MAVGGRLNHAGQTFWVPLVLIGLLWVARYWHSSAFGIYEDDLTVIPRAVSMSTPELLDYVGNFIVHLYDDGRPLFNSLNVLLAAFSWRAAGMTGPYLLGFLIESVNAVLFYTLIRRLYGQKVAAFAGVAYVLYSADTTQAWLHRSLGAEPSLTLLFLALHAYLSDRLVLAYGLAAVILFSYESPYTVFLCAPLLAGPRGRGKRREWIRHLAITLSVLAGAYFLRRTIGTERVTGQAIGEMLQTSVIHALEGPVVSLGTYALRPLQAAASLNGEVLLAAVLSLPIFLLLLGKRWGTSAVPDDPSRQAAMGLRASFQEYGRPLLAGLAMLTLAYLLTFTVRAYAISGRDTRVHFAAGPGAALAIASLACILLTWLRPGKMRWAGAAGLAVMLALLLGFGFVIQQDYVTAWTYQQEFWTQVVALVPDASEGTAILVNPDALKDTRHIAANYWNLPRVLEQIFSYPADWSTPPRVYRLAEGWEDKILGPDGALVLDEGSAFIPPANYTQVSPDRTVLLEGDGQGLVRRETMILQGKTYALQPRAAGPSETYPHGFLYDYLILAPEAAP